RDQPGASHAARAITAMERGPRVSPWRELGTSLELLESNRCFFTDRNTTMWMWCYQRRFGRGHQGLLPAVKMALYTISGSPAGTRGFEICVFACYSDPRSR
ncbi:MAG: hypothetical protein R6U98_10145, partial [Pirellulaceae bacterium]